MITISRIPEMIIPPEFVDAAAAIAAFFVNCGTEDLCSGNKSRMKLDTIEIEFRWVLHSIMKRYGVFDLIEHSGWRKGFM